MRTQKEQDFEALYQRNKDKIYRLCLGFVREKELANDLFQEILIKIWRHLESFKGESDISTWIYRIAYNTALTFTTKEKKKADQETEIPESLELAEPDSFSQEQEKQLQLLYQ